MWWVISALAAKPGPAPEPSFVHAVFDAPAERDARDKLIRVAMKRARTLSSGRDWGRVVCFQFAGPPERDALERALDKARLHAELRDAVDCVQAPPEALAPPPPIAWRRVRFAEPFVSTVAQERLAPLLGPELGVVAVKVSPERVGVACLEFAYEPDPVALDSALAEHAAGAVAEAVRSCGEALAGAR